MVAQTMENAVLLRKQVLLVPVLPVFPLLPDDLCSDFHKPHGILLNSKGTDIEMCVTGLKLKHLSFKC